MNDPHIPTPPEDPTPPGDTAEAGTAPDRPPPVDPFPTGYTNEGVPTLDYVRDKIEGRLATSLGAAELAEESAAGRDIADQEAERARKAKEKLDEIRRSLGS